MPVSPRHKNAAARNQIELIQFADKEQLKYVKKTERNEM